MEPEEHLTQAVPDRSRIGWEIMTAADLPNPLPLDSGETDGFSTPKPLHAAHRSIFP